MRLLALSWTAALALSACTAVNPDEIPDVGPPDGGIDAAAADGGLDAGADGGLDAAAMVDARVDAGNDASLVDASADGGDPDGGSDGGAADATLPDAGCLLAWHEDCDDDGYAASGAGTMSSCSEPPTPACGGGWTTRAPSGADVDCDGENGAVSPGATEIADNGIDDDCDEAHGCYFDMDNDGYSRSDGAVRDTSPDAACTGAGEGSSTEPRTDCNDASSAVSPGDPEVGDNGIDDDCDGVHGCWVDSDNDGYRTDEVLDGSIDAACTSSGEGQTSDPNGDCNDMNAGIHPGAGC